MFLQFRRANSTAPTEANDLAPFPVTVPENLGDDAGLPPVAGRPVSRTIVIPGIGTGAAYTDGEAFGGVFQIPDFWRPGKHAGWLTGVALIDKDDEGLQVDVALFTRSITETADNNAFAPSDTDLEACIHVVSVDTFYNWSANQFGYSSASPRYLVAAGVSMWAQCIARGAINIAAGSIPRLKFTGIQD